MKQKLNAFLLLIGFLILPFTMIGQKTISGQLVDDESNEPLIGASVSVPGSTIGTVTDIDGKYTLTVPEGTESIRVTYTGYPPKDIALGLSNVYNMRMTSGEVLSEVVVIGYGTVKREDLTGSVGVVNEDKFAEGALTTPEALIAGKVAGVNISTGGDPGGGSSILIRGRSSLDASNAPLVVIDGIPVENSTLPGGRGIYNLVNPNDIETMTVLKDASATAIYGSRASGGVIIITTKKGKLGKKIGVNYSGNIGFMRPLGTQDVLSADEFKSYIRETFAGDSAIINRLGTDNTNWQDQIYQRGIVTDHNLSLSGGVGIIPYRVSFGYTDNQSVLTSDRFRRTTAAINLSPGFLDNTLQVNFSAKAQLTKNRFADRGAIGNAINFDPSQPVLDPESPYGGYFTYTNPDGTPSNVAPTNPLALIEQRTNTADINRFLVNASIDYRLPFLKELRANLSLGTDRGKGEGGSAAPREAEFVYGDEENYGEDNLYRGERNNDLIDFYLNYNKKLGAINLDLTAGYSWQHFIWAEDFFENKKVAQTTQIVTGDQPRELYLASLFGRANLTIAEDFLLTMTLRRDGTSRFSEDNRWGLFPAAAFAWKIIENDSKGLSALKFRAGWGVTGQQDIGNKSRDYYAYLPVYTSSFDNASYPFGGNVIGTLRPEGYTSDIKWEENRAFNIGLDYGFVDDRILGSVEYFRTNSVDLLSRITPPAGSNLTNSIVTNIGNMEVSGVEFSINAIPVQTANLTWDFSFNATFNSTEITKLNLSDDPNFKGNQVGGIAGGVGNTIGIHAVGHAPFSFLVYEQVYDDSGNPIEGLYVDRNGDGTITPEDQYIYESPDANSFYGYATSLVYKNIGLSLGGRAFAGNYVYNNNLSNGYLGQMTNNEVLRNLPKDAIDLGFQNAQFFSDHFVEDGSFLKLDYITLSYNMKDLISKANNMQVYATVQNPLLITNYSGIDPEITDGTNPGVDNNIYPRSRTILFGINAGF